MGRKVRTIYVQLSGLECQKKSGRRRGIFLDFSFYRTLSGLGRHATQRADPKTASGCAALRLELQGQLESPRNSGKSASLIQFAVKAQVVSANKFGDKYNLPIVHSEVFHHLVNRS
jgi:hypothetical protein